MNVKYYLAQGADADKSMMELMALARKNGQDGLGGLTNDRNGVSLAKNNGALVIVGGRDSISRSLYNSGGIPLILGSRPFLLSFARKHRVLGKNETCLKVVCGTGHKQPEDGSEFVTLGAEAKGTQLALNPVELAHNLYFIYGWG